ncbi:Protein SUPPRESSOR OF GENE SILENCING 3 [Acorus gramineus]|uniref:Protein SUPPRESSOR OF GENE SILENCING 3 n=1 Tax=Acorus gramineus TaxID=55184 RepID=A0AAV9BHL9_ACOGR|nr:Protein SUPPRESSOR OF GENE SILENCING 3 [Acorus gramineus]
MKMHDDVEELNLRAFPLNGYAVEMNSKKGGSGGAKPSAAGAANAYKGKGIESSGSGNNSPKLDQVNRDMADINLDSAQDGDWEVYGKKNKNRSGTDGIKSWGSWNSAPRARGPSEGQQRPPGLGNNAGSGRLPANNWVQTVDNRRPGRGNVRPPPSNRNLEPSYTSPAPVMAPPLQSGWNWNARNGSTVPQQRTPEWGMEKEDNVFEDDLGSEANEDDDADDDILDDDDDDFSDDYDSDVSQKSFETRKKNKWFRAFFEALDSFTVDQINETTRQWHCPACHDGPGAIDWYKGLQPLMTHAKTKGSKRVKLHREFASLLEEDLQKRGTSVQPASEAYGKWRGLHESARDCEIVWPPMVVVMNTLLERDDNEKWIGMGNQELLEYFHTYPAIKARHSYGPHGHRGMSLLIFEASAIGYLEAERLHKHFAEQGTDRDAWDRRRQLFYQGGKRQLYGYMATKEDMNVFNQHSQGKSRLKFEMRSYHEMVRIPMNKMHEDNQLLSYYKNKVAKEQLHSKTLQDSFGVVSQKLRETMEENKIVRLRSKIQHEENKEEMDYQENFFKEQLDKIHESIEEKERMFEKSLQDDLDAKQVDVDSGSNEDRQLKEEEVKKFIEGQTKDIEEYEAKRDKLVQEYEEEKVKMRRRHLEEEVELEKKLNDTLTQLIEKYAPKALQASTSNLDGGSETE